MSHRHFTRGVALALATTLVVPVAQASASTPAASASAARATAVGPKASASSGAQPDVSSSSAERGKPSTKMVRTVGGRQIAVPQATSSALGAPRPTPSGPVLYVSDASGSGCSDTAAGAGTQAVPFCTLQAAADAVVPGDTVLVTPGNYTGFALTAAHGTAQAPITFESSYLPATGTLTGLIRIEAPTTGTTPVHAIDVEDSSHIGLENFRVFEELSSDAVLINASQYVTLDQFMDWTGYGSIPQPAPDIHVTGDSTGVTVTRASLFNDYGAPYIQIDAGGSNDVIADNALWANDVTTITVDGTPNTEVTGNSLLISHETAISLTGNSQNSTIENNVVGYTNFPGSGGAPVLVGPDATAGTTLDYNLIGPTGATVYQWGDATYATGSALAAATGQGAHDIEAIPDIYLGGEVLMLDYNSPGIDSANAAAPGEQSTDILGQSCVNDPSYPVTGTGTPAYCSRGSYQYQDPLTALLRATSTGTLSVQADATASHGRNGISGYSFDFGDGTAPTVNTTGKATHTYAHSGTYSVTVTATDSTDATNTSTATTIKTAGADFTAIGPTRILDTRRGIGSPQTKITAGGWVNVPIPALDPSHGAQITAVALNVTVTDATGNGYMGLSYGSSSLNYLKGQTLAATIIAPILPDNGTNYVQLQVNGAGTVDLIADMTGYFATDATDGYQPINPLRLMDTRKGTGGSTGKIDPGKTDVLTVAGAGGNAIPATGVTALAVNLTVTDTTGNGLITAYPDGQAAPGTSNLNFTAGQILSNFAIVPVGADGKIDVSDTHAGTDVIVDVVGYFDASGGSAYVAAGPYRDIDTRRGSEDCSTYKGALKPDGTLTASLTCTPGSFDPADTGNITAFALNHTVTEGTSSGYLTAYPAGGALPAASDLDWQHANENVANLTIAGTGTGGQVTFANRSGGTVQLIVDVYGYFANS